MRKTSKRNKGAYAQWTNIINTLPVVVPRPPALSTTDALGLHVTLQVEGGLVVVLVVRGGRAGRGRALLLLVHRARALVAHVLVLRVGRVLRHHERLVVELERVVVVGRGGLVGVVAVRVVRGGAAGARVVRVGRVRVRVERVRRVRGQRRRRHGTAVLARRRSNAGMQYTSACR